jgi:hypothetical protein
MAPANAMAMTVIRAVRVHIGASVAIARAVGEPGPAPKNHLFNIVTGNAPLLAYGAAFAAETALLSGALLAYGRLHIRAARALSAG